MSDPADDALELRRRFVNDYRELVRADLTDIAQELERLVTRAGLVYSGVMGCRIPEPLVVAGSVYDRNCSIARSIVRALRTATAALVSDESLRRAVGVPEYLEPLLAIDLELGDFPLFGRLDGLTDERGGLVGFIEFNSEPDGFLYVSELAHFFSSLSAMTLLGTRFNIRHQHIYRQAVGALFYDYQRRGGEGPLHLARAVRASTTPSDQRYSWMPFLKSCGTAVTIAESDAFALQNERLVVGGRPVDYIVPERWDTIISGTAADPILRAVSRGLVRSVNGIARGLLSSYKQTFEILSDASYEHLFDRSTVAALRRCIPWTRLLRERKTTLGDRTVDLVEHALHNRESLVLKPCGSSQGFGVVLGAEVTQSEWERAIDLGLKRASVIQRRLVTPRQVFPWTDSGDVSLRELWYDWPIYTWNMNSVGYLMPRAGPNQPMNVASGASFLGTVVIDDPSVAKGRVMVAT